jgi:pimeloyl-ACP methyl ester carboxylesterase
MSIIREQRLELGGFTTRALELEPDGGVLDGADSLLLLHGFSDSADTWRPLLAQLARHGRHALAVDLPGFGQAGGLDREAEVLPQLDRFAAAAVGELAAQSPGGSVTLVGNSLGGCVAMRAAQEDGHAISGVVPIAPAGLDMARWISIIEGAPLVRFLLRAPVPLPETVVRGAVGRVYRTLAFADTKAIDPAVVSSFTRHVRTRRDVSRILATGRRVVGELGNPFRLELIDCPVLLVWGDRDRMVFATGADRVLEQVAGSRMELIEGCGHCPQVECPDRLAELLAEFPAAFAPTA